MCKKSLKTKTKIGQIQRNDCQFRKSRIKQQFLSLKTLLKMMTWTNKQTKAVNFLRFKKTMTQPLRHASICSEDVIGSSWHYVTFSAVQFVHRLQPRLPQEATIFWPNSQQKSDKPFRIAVAPSAQQTNCRIFCCKHM